MRIRGHFLIPTLSYLLCTAACREPKVVTGRSYFSAFPDGERRHTVLDSYGEGDTLSASGVYDFTPIAAGVFPVLLSLNPRRGAGQVHLGDTLDVERGAWLEVTGVTATRKVSTGVRGAAIELKVLRVLDWQIRRDISPCIQRAQREYRERRDRIQQAIDLEGSKLQLPARPEWSVLVNESEGEVVVGFRAADLMYAAAVDLVLDLERCELENLYAGQWFKGE